jgi:alkanesulfonate monooxygenase SsuD/methylene tetrahydromethanopterin reductase-like flavin-dependent oxidoreductase (luciferase family)
MISSALRLLGIFAHLDDASLGNEEEIDALVRTLVVSGTEEPIRHRLKELLAGGLDELMLQLLPIADEEGERKQLIHLVGSL